MKLAIIIMSMLVMGSITSVYASSKSPYQSGYGHGRDDCSESPGDRYITDHPANEHTNEFMRGYNAGYNSCSDGGSSGGSSGSGGSRESLATKICNLVDNNRGAAALLARGLGFYDLDQAVLALCNR